MMNVVCKTYTVHSESAQFTKVHTVQYTICIHTQKYCYCCCTVPVCILYRVQEVRPRTLLCSTYTVQYNNNIGQHSAAVVKTEYTVHHHMVCTLCIPGNAVYSIYCSTQQYLLCAPCFRNKQRAEALGCRT